MLLSKTADNVTCKQINQLGIRYIPDNVWVFFGIGLFQIYVP